MMPNSNLIAKRFRGFLPVVIDLETAGFNAETDALLEICAVIIGMDVKQKLYIRNVFTHHILPFEGANLEQKSLDFIGMRDPFHPFRGAIDEKIALQKIFTEIRRELKEVKCQRAIMVAHNAFFDMSFLQQAIKRNALKRNPFHSFSSFDTVSLAAMAVGETVLAKAVRAVGIDWDNAKAHSAEYDANKTAELFCYIINHWDNTLRKDKG